MDDNMCTWVKILVVLLVWSDITMKGPFEYDENYGRRRAAYAFPVEFEKKYLDWDDMSVEEKKNSDLQGGGGGFEVKGGTPPSRVIVVDQYGDGDSFTVQGAVDMVPPRNGLRHKIYIRPGIYREKVHVPKSKPFISFIGAPGRSSETIITWHDKASDKNQYGCELGTYRSASVTVESDYFCAKDITFENSIVAVPGTDDMQAVALRLKGDKAWLHKVRILGTQDTLLDESGLHFFDQCFIQGSVDFIFGNAKSLYQSCILNSVANHTGAIAANHRNSLQEDSGFSFVNCNITGSGKVLLGRAWGNYSTAIYSYCHFNDIIAPQGWSDWSDAAKDGTAVFGEFQCKGKGADRRNRVPWSKSFSTFDADPFLTTKYIDGHVWLQRP